MRRIRSSLGAAGFTLALVACIGTTGGEVVSFRAFATGTAGATAQGLTFENGRGWTITLTRARVHIGALYLNRSVPVSGGQERECFLPGVYVAQVLRGIDVDALSPAMQPFPDPGTGTADHAVTGEVWLTGGRIDDLDDPTPIADVAGSAVRGGESLRFEGTITIGKNRVAAQTDPARPGANPLCAERIVTPIPVSITPKSGGSLIVHVDPRAWFANVELAELEPISPESDLRRFVDERGASQPSENLYRGLRASAGVYSFEFVTSQSP